MNKWAFILLLLLCNEHAYGQSVGEEEFDLSDLSGVQFDVDATVNSTANSVWDDLDRNFSGSIGSFNSFSKEGSKTNIHFLKLRYENSLGPVEVSLEGILPSIDIQLVHTIKDEIEPDDDLPSELEFGYQDDRLVVNEAYVSAALGDWGKISAGRSVVAWGQFDPLSPMNLVFPINFTPTEIEPSKIAFTLPQDNISLSVFAGENAVVTAYYFPLLNFHRVFENSKINVNLETYEKPVVSPIQSGPGAGTAASDDPNAVKLAVVEEDVSIALPKGGEAAQFAIRSLFYFEDSTWGISYYDGWDTNRIAKFNTLATLSTSGNPDIFFPEKSIGVNRQRALGFEYSTFVNDWNIIAEATLSTGTEELVFSKTRLLNAAQEEYRLWIVNQNKSRLYIDTIESVVGLGVAKKFDRWSLNFGLFKNFVYYRGDAKEGIRLQERAFPDEAENYPVYPVMNIQRYMGDKKDASVGVATGVLGYGYGATMYYSKSLKESFKLGVSLRSIKYFVDDILVPEQFDSQYEAQASSSTALSVNVSYVF